MSDTKWIVLLLLILINGCRNKSQDDGLYKTFPNDGTGLPLPEFDKDFDEIVGALEKEFNAESVRVTRPFDFNSENKPECWLKVSLLNPEMPQVDYDPFTGFAHNVAEWTYAHLTNSDKFNKIEISVEQTAGTFSSTISKFLWRDSLKSTLSSPLEPGKVERKESAL